jgi:hypothetical protein
MPWNPGGAGNWQPFSDPPLFYRRLLLTLFLLALVSITLLLAVAALLQERRLRLALQEILKRLLFRWRSCGTNRTDDPSSRDRPGNAGDSDGLQG